MNSSSSPTSRNTTLSWRNLNLRSKLIIILLLASLIPLIIISVVSDAGQTKALTNDANAKLLSAADVVVVRVDSFMQSNLDVIRAEGRAPAVVEYVSLPESQRAGSPEEARMNTFLLSVARQDPVYINSVAILDTKGITLADTLAGRIGADRSGRYYFQEVLATQRPYASTLEYDEVTKHPSLYFAAPIRDKNGTMIGVLRKRFDAAILQKFITAETGLAGEESFAVLIDENFVRIAHGTNRDNLAKSIVPIDPATLVTLQEKRFMPAGTSEEHSTNIPEFQAGLENYETTPFFTADLTGQGDLEAAAVVKSTTQPWLIVFAQPQAIFLEPINTQRTTNILIALLIAGAVAAFGVFVSQTISGPVSRLTQVAESIAGGNVNIQAKVETGDEIGTLAGTFNRMTQQLRDLIVSLEERVAARTRNLELAGEVGRTVSQVRALDVMLTDAAELIRSQFDLYYVQVYLVNPSQTYLNLQAGTGEVGKQLLARNHRLALNINSINGRAAIEKKPVVISDTTANATFTPNPLLPNTRSEMAVPLVVGERVVGVLDMQSEIGGSLSADILPAFTALAGQVAIAIQNATFLAETNQARAEVEAQAQRLSRANWVDYLDAIHKPEESGFVFEQNKITTMAQGAGMQFAENAFVKPITVTGEALGNLVVEMGGQSPIARTDELLNTVAQQVARQIESLRLLDSAERYRFQAEEASRRVTREGWQDYKKAKTEDSMSYSYDLKEVLPYHSNGGSQKEEFAFSLPVKVRDETVGKFSVLGLDSDDTESVDLANAVVERLGAHIESLRLFEQTEQRRSEAESLVRELDIQKYALDQHSIVAITDVTGKITYANDKFVEISKYSREELIGQDHRMLNSGYHPKEFIRNLWVTIANGKVFHGELHNKAKDGSLYWVDTTIVPLLNSEGKPERYLAIRTDITQRKHDEEINIKRAAELDTVAEISTVSAAILDSQEMLDSVVNLTKDRFNLYHAHVYLMDDAGENLVLTSGAGEIGKQMVSERRTIPLNSEHSLVARAARSGKGAISNDVTKEQDFLPNPLLPDTLSEMAVPMIVGSKVTGVFDVQGNIINRFTEEDVRIKTTLATQVATALQNARTFTQAQRQADRESTLNIISQKIQSATTVEAVLQIAARELGHALGAPMTIAQLSMKDKK